jgi:hypothetical protein
MAAVDIAAINQRLEPVRFQCLCKRQNNPRTIEPFYQTDRLRVMASDADRQQVEDQSKAKVFISYSRAKIRRSFGPESSTKTTRLSK